MPAIKITGFQGELPKVDPRHLPSTGAQVAQDVRLDDGILTPVRASSYVATMAAANYKTILKFDGSWLGWTSRIHAAPGPVAADRLYYTGDGVPKVRVGATTYDLAVSPPSNQLTAVVSGSGTGPNITRTYVFTYVTSLGEESEPSPVSAQVTMQEGQTVTLSNFDTPPGGRITLQRIYRTQTGTSGTGLYLIDERAVSASNYVDTNAADDFQEALPSIDYNAPPSDLEGLVSMANGMMAAFKGKKLYFCEPWQPHAWPEKYILTTHDNIVGLAYVGDLLVVLTEGNTELCYGSMPEAMQLKRLEAEYPCTNEASIVDMGFAVVYTSHSGLIAVDAAGNHKNVTTDMFNRDTWQALEPETFVCSQHDGRYCAFYSYVKDGDTQAGMMLFEVGSSPWMSRSKISATAAFYNNTDGSMIYQPTGDTKIYRYDDPDTYRQNMYWKTKEFIFPYPENFGCMRIDGDEALSADEAAKLEAERNAIIAANAAIIAADNVLGAINTAEINAYAFAGDNLAPVPMEKTVQVVVYADGDVVFTADELNKTLRLPSGFKARKWEFDVSANVRVDQIHVARTINELSRT